MRDIYTSDDCLALAGDLGVLVLFPERVTDLLGAEEVQLWVLQVELWVLGREGQQEDLAGRAAGSVVWNPWSPAPNGGPLLSPYLFQ